jgi:ORF6N domain
MKNISDRILPAKHGRVTQLVPVERIEQLILIVRGEKVLLDADLAKLYGVSTGNLNKSVKRNRRRFPPDFMFRLNAEESVDLIFHFGRSNLRGGRRHRPFAFTEQGVAMLSSVLRSKRAMQVNVAIMRAFVGLRRMLADHETLARKLADLEQRLGGHDESIKSLFDAIRELMSPPAVPRREIGFHTRADSPEIRGAKAARPLAQRRVKHKAEQKQLEDAKRSRLPFKRMDRCPDKI